MILAENSRKTKKLKKIFKKTLDKMRWKWYTICEKSCTDGK